MYRSMRVEVETEKHENVSVTKVTKLRFYRGAGEQSVHRLLCLSSGWQGIIIDRI
jgi:hypothetical protein